jgi:replicative DNA helicase
MLADGIDLDLASDDDRDPSIPPGSRQAEDAVIGSILKNPRVIGDLAVQLRPEDFTSVRHRAAYAAAVALARRQIPTDYTTPGEEMAAQGSMSAGEAVRFLAAVDLMIPTAAFASHYAGIVSRYATFRRLISAAQTIAEDGWRDVGDPDAAIARSIARLVAIRRGLPQDLVTPAEWAESTQQALEQGDPISLLGLSTGLNELDVALLGLVPSEVYVLGARTSAGKTTLLVQIAHHVAINHGPVLFVSLEMKPELLFDRILAGVANVSVNRLALRTLYPDERQRALSSVKQLGDIPLFVLRRRYLTAEIRDALLALEAMNQRAALVVVDFIQMIQDQAETSRADWAHYGEAAKRLKLIAEEFGVPILAASQLNRASEYEKRPPTLADFSLSDQIVQYADSVIALYREKDDAGGSRTVIPILKRRNYGRAAGEALEIVWSGQKYVDPHPAAHYRNLLNAPMSTAPLSGNGVPPNPGANPPIAKPGSDLPW